MVAPIDVSHGLHDVTVDGSGPVLPAACTQCTPALSAPKHASEIGSTYVTAPIGAEKEPSDKLSILTPSTTPCNETKMRYSRNTITIFFLEKNLKCIKPYPTTYQPAQNIAAMISMSLSQWREAHTARNNVLRFPSTKP